MFTNEKLILAKYLGKNGKMSGLPDYLKFEKLRFGGKKCPFLEHMGSLKLYISMYIKEGLRVFSPVNTTCFVLSHSSVPGFELN